MVRRPGRGITRFVGWCSAPPVWSQLPNDSRYSAISSTCSAADSGRTTTIPSSTICGYSSGWVSSSHWAYPAIAAAVAALSIPTAAAIVDAAWREILADHSGVSGSAAEALAAASAGAAGSGAIPFTSTLTSDVDSSPIVDADVWVTSDAGGNTVLASGETDSNGQVVFYLDAGTVYVWRQKAGWDFCTPDTETVS